MTDIRPLRSTLHWRNLTEHAASSTVHTNASRKTELLENALQIGGDCKRSFISTVRPTFHTNPSRKRSFSKTFFKSEKFENAVSSTVHTNPSRKRSFLKTLFKPEDYENAVFAFQWRRKTVFFKTELVENDDVTIIT